MAVCRAVAAVALAFILLPLLHQSPYYPPAVERLVASIYDRQDAFLRLPHVEWSFLRSAAGHFEGMLRRQPSAPFFEGWYYKVVGAAGATFVAIPGVLFDGVGEDPHGFVMVAHAAANRTAVAKYHRFPIADVKLTSLPRDGFRLEIGENVFTERSVELHISGVAEGSLELREAVPYEATTLQPTVMGWFAFVDALVGMQCSHGVVAVHARSAGAMRVEGLDESFAGATAYVEKDWGSSFPRRWVWLQSNAFDASPRSSLMLSVASIPFPNDRWALVTFSGFLGFLYDGPSERLYRFGTYTGATVEFDCDTPAGCGSDGFASGERVRLVVRDAQFLLNVTATGERASAALLWGPRPAAGALRMEPFVDEMLRVRVEAVLARRSDGAVLFRGVGRDGGLEIEQ